jgi:hypothetical protein
MPIWLIVVVLVAGAVLAFPLAILISAGLGYTILLWQNTTMHLWLKERTLREGVCLVRWPAKDLREDIRIVDLSRLSEHVVGVQKRRYCVLHRTEPPPQFGDVEYVLSRNV